MNKNQIIEQKLYGSNIQTKKTVDGQYIQNIGKKVKEVYREQNAGGKMCTFVGGAPSRFIRGLFKKFQD